jgi:hypothetical protein
MKKVQTPLELDLEEEKWKSKGGEKTGNREPTD